MTAKQQNLQPGNITLILFIVKLARIKDQRFYHTNMLADIKERSLHFMRVVKLTSHLEIMI